MYGVCGYLLFLIAFGATYLTGRLAMYLFAESCDGGYGYHNYITDKCVQINNMTTDLLAFGLLVLLLGTTLLWGIFLILSDFYSTLVDI